MGTAPSKAEIAHRIAERMALIAHPDSRFGRDFTQFIPSFDGADRAASDVLALPECQSAKRVFITPDNAVCMVRQLLIKAGVDLIVPSYGLYRGFLHVSAGEIPATAVPNSGWLDAIESYGASLELAELSALGPVDVIVTGSSAITLQGLRFGMGDFYLDIEWAMLRSLGLFHDQTTVIAVVHDDEVTDRPFDREPTNVAADVIVTPTRTIRVGDNGPQGRPTVLDRAIVPPALMATATLQNYCDLAERSLSQPLS